MGLPAIWRNLNNYFDIHVCLSFRRRLRRRASVRKLIPISAVGSQNITNKSCLVCVMSAKYAFWVTLRPQSDCCCRGEAEVRILDFKNTWSEFQKPSQTVAKHGKAELRIFDFKTTWSEFQRPSQTATGQGETELWACQTAVMRGEAELHILDFKTT